MKAYGADKFDTSSCRWGCCGGLLARIRSGSRCDSRRRLAAKRARRRARQQGKQEARVA